MTTQTEALKLALEALKQIDEVMPFPVAKLAQKAIKEVLAQPEQEQSGFFSREAMKEHSDFHVAQPEHEKYCSVCQGCGQLDTGIMESPVTICNACNGTGLKAQPEQEPVAWQFRHHANTGKRWGWCDEEQANRWGNQGVEVRALYTTPPQRIPQFKEFIKWAGAQGYDCAQTCNSDTGEWIVLNPMTADLWKAWQAAHGIKE